MAKCTVSKGGQGPAIRAVEPWAPSAGRMHQLLTDDERSRLSVVASIVRFKKGAVIYREGERVDAIFNIIGGVVTPYRTAPDGSEYIGAFLFADDVFGLSEEGRYTNSMRAITPVTAYRLPVSALRSRFLKDAGLEFRVICKLCQETPSSPASRISAEPEKSNHQACDVFANDRTTPNCQRRANSRNLSSDGPFTYRRVRRNDACGREQGISEPDHARYHYGPEPTACADH